MKKILLFSVITLSALAGIGLIMVNLPGTGFSDTQKKKVLLISLEQLSKDSVQALLHREDILKYPKLFEFMANKKGYWKDIRPGRYEITTNTSTLKILKKLAKGETSPLNLVINKFRTKEDFAGFLGRKLYTDSLHVIQFLNSPDSTGALGLDTVNILTAVIPDTYSVDWMTPHNKLIRRLFAEREKFWSTERQTMLKKTGLTKEEAYNLASIIEEESNKNDEKPIIASVYLNRLNKQMPLGADPTIKFALRDFKLKRITFKHIQMAGESPYNTYKVKGIPPGPICTPSIKSIEAVISPAVTDYLFFCAKPDFSGYHNFASNEREHFQNARAYQKALDKLSIK